MRRSTSLAYRTCRGVICYGQLPLTYCVLAAVRSTRVPFFEPSGFLTFLEIGKLGRLGNQLFQVASTIGIAESRGVSWRFPHNIENSTVGQLFHLKGQGISHLVDSKYDELTGLYHDVRVKPAPGRGISLHGYFQDYRYFNASTKTLQTYFQFSSELVRVVLQKVPELTSRDSVTLHVRRGDYIHATHVYNLLSSSYYVQALERIPSIDVVIILSDDISWCKHHLLPHISHTVIFSPFDNPVLDFILMSLGRHKIIANSSFSWWAAYMKEILGDKTLKDGKVIAPRPWYNRSGTHAYLNSDGFYPAGWTVLESTSAHVV